MARYLLDTNILMFLMSSELDDISSDVKSLMEDYNNRLYVSSISVTELLQLYRIGKIKAKKYKTSTELQEAIEKDYFIEILPFAKEHTKTLEGLRISKNHNDPFDHAIISHAITDKLILISSDRKFEDYTAHKLNFVFNNRR